jgi:hypothetical protein
MVGLVPHFEDGRLSLLQYVGYTIIYLEHVLEKTKNLKLILFAFVQLSRDKNQFPNRVVLLGRSLENAA